MKVYKKEEYKFETRPNNNEKDNYISLNFLL